MRDERAADEMTLDMVRMRCAGMGPVQIAELYGVTSQYVSTATNRVRHADRDESGEDVRGAYW